MRTLVDMSTTVDRENLLGQLRANRAEHAELLQKTTIGFLAKAKTQVAARLKMLENGEATSLHFDLEAPQDHTHTYDVVIRMMEDSVNTEVTLTGAQYRNLVMDEWDWTERWLHMNQQYAGAAVLAKSSSLGLS